MSDQRKDFNPDGLEKYWLDEAKTYNEESMRYLREIEVILKNLIAEQLENERGENWLIIGLPKAVYSRAKKESDDQNYDIISNGGSGESISIWDCITLSECKDIVTNGKNWSEIFENILTRPKDSKISGGKEAKTQWISQLSSINNKLAKATYSVSTEEYNFIIEVDSWIKLFTSTADKKILYI